MTKGDSQGVSFRLFQFLSKSVGIFSGSDSALWLGRIQGLSEYVTLIDFYNIHLSSVWYECKLRGIPYAHTAVRS